VLKTIIGSSSARSSGGCGDAPLELVRRSDAVVDAIAARCTEVESGARNIDNILTNTVLPASRARRLPRSVSS
jgi:type VI secretion system protein VasG